MYHDVFGISTYMNTYIYAVCTTNVFSIPTYTNTRMCGVPLCLQYYIISTYMNTCMCGVSLCLQYTAYMNTCIYAVYKKNKK